MIVRKKIVKMVLLLNKILQNEHLQETENGIMLLPCYLHNHLHFFVQSDTSASDTETHVLNHKSVPVALQPMK